MFIVFYTLIELSNFMHALELKKLKTPAFYQHRIEDAPIDLPITNEIYIHSKAAKKKKKIQLNLNSTTFVLEVVWQAQKNPVFWDYF